ncbi:MurR/RpiR family transcriptional regulator [Nocardioides hungaricus]
MTVADRIAEVSSSLTAAERQAADALLSDRQRVAFGTVAENAAVAGVGASTILRLAVKIGFDGFSSLQAAVQQELSRDLEPPSARIKHIALDESLSDIAAAETLNVYQTLQNVDPEVLGQVADAMADLDRRLVVVAGEAAAGVAREFMTNLYALRDEVWLLDGNDVVIGRNLARLRSSDVMIVFSVRPYDRWVVRAAQQARSAGVWTALVTDSAVSPIVPLADAVMLVSTETRGAFESNVGTLALCNLLVTTVGVKVGGPASERLGQAEGSWRELDSFINW